MEMKVIDDRMARRFLLGDVSSAEQERIQEMAFADPDTFTLIEAAQDDLIDDFVNDELSAEEKERFQNYFLVQPGRQQDIRIGRALQQYWAHKEQPITGLPDQTPKPPPKPPIFDWLRLRPATVALALLLVILAAGLLAVYLAWRGGNQMQAQQHPTPPPPLPSASPAVTPPQATPSPTPRPSQGSPSPSPRQSVEPIYAVVLVPGGPARSEGEETKVAPVSAPITLELPLVDDSSFQSYRAVLQKDGRTIRTWSNLQPKELQTGRGIAIVAPAGLLQNLQRYRITLSGISAGKSQVVNNYHFVVSN
jgi:hypothetical protein